MTTTALVLLASLVGSSAAAAVNLTARGELFARDNLVPLPGCSTYADRKWQPGLDFDKDSCYNVAAISPSGKLNPGLSCVSLPYTNCRDEYDLLNQNVYSRSRCNGGWCAHMYAYYFEKDVSDPLCAGGHDHDWEHIVVWTRADKAEWVAISQHGKYYWRKFSDLPRDGTHVRVVYHKDGGLTHVFRFPKNNDEKPENHKKVWFRSPDLISYYGFPAIALRTRLLDHNWGTASIDFRDAVFRQKLESARPSEVQGFNAGRDGPEDIHNSPGIPDGNCGVRS
ncbi:Necrosis inducing protein (NPP1) domain containing protein [Naviculisporaceae sp. PSN 640]